MGSCVHITCVQQQQQQQQQPSADSLGTFKSYRNLYNKTIRAAKKLFFERELLLNQSNLKKSWDLIRMALNKKVEKSSSISSLFVNNITVTDPLSMANHFNEFFTSIASKIVDEINPTVHPRDINHDSDSDIPLFSFFNVPITEAEIVTATNLLQAKKTLDFTGISVWLVQKVILSISAPLHHIFLQSFSNGIVPQQLKTAKIIPVIKSGKKDAMDNYRPISLLSCFSKIIEKIVCSRLTEFLDVNNLITKSQYGFRKKHATVHPLVHFLNFVSSSLDRKEHSVAIFCDLRKAFDTVDHKILLNKLGRMGIRGVELAWFQDYLSNRKQIVHINGSNSFLQNILIGVPQGSILGPLLFLIYINDLPLCSELLALLFADDTTLLLSDPDLDSLIARVNLEFKKISDFFRSLKLALHPAKTKFILFSNSSEARSKDISIFLDFNNSNVDPDVNLISCLERVTCESSVPAIKFLGIYIDPLLNFKFHIETVVSKVSRSLYFPRNSKHILTPTALKAVYYALVHCHFIYGIQIWSCTAPSNLNVLVSKQKIAIRLICGAKYNSHTEPLFKISRILPLPLLIEFFKLQFMLGFLNNLLPSSFDNMWTVNAARRLCDQPILRNHYSLFLPTSRLSSTEKFPLLNFPRLWSNFPDTNIKQMTSKPEFNSKLKCYFLDSLTLNYQCTRLLCPHCHLGT